MGIGHKKLGIPNIINDKRKDEDMIKGLLRQF